MKSILRFFFGTAFRKGATVLSTLTFFSYVSGLVRDRLFAQNFGASRTLDVYNAAFIIPDLLLNIFVAGALTAAFVPVFTHLWSTGEHAEAERTATTTLVSAVSVVFLVGIITFFLMPWLSGFIAPGFSGADKELLIKTSRLMLISPLIFAISNTLGNILISYERFTGYGLSPLLYNLGIIGGTIFLRDYGVFGLVIGTLAGAALHLITRIYPLLRSGFRFKTQLNFTSESFRKILKLMVPKMVGQPVEQLIFLTFTNLASTLAAGSIVMLSFARNFNSVPVSLFGISFSTAVFSALSRHVANHDKKAFAHHFWETAKWLLIASVLSAIFYFLLGEFVIKIFLGGGRFGDADIKTTGILLSMFALAIPSESLIHLLARSFYALKDTLTAVSLSVAGLIIIVLLAILLTPTFGIIGLPLSFAIGSNAEMIVMGVLLHRKYRRWATPPPSPSAR